MKNIFIALISLLLSACSIQNKPTIAHKTPVNTVQKMDDLRTEALLKTFKIHRDMLQEMETPPPIAAKQLAYHSIMYQDIVYSKQNKTLPYFENALEIPENIDIEKLIYAVNRVYLTTLYPDYDGLFENISKEETSEITALAQKVVSRTLQNVSRERYYTESADYIEPDGDDKWRRTAPFYQEALLPNWGKMKPLRIDDVTKYRAPKPYITHGNYEDDKEEVRLMGDKNSTTRDDDETEIAQFWTDGKDTYTPIGTWNEIAEILIRQRKDMSFEEAADVYYTLSTTLYDASIICWDTKYAYGFIRPITALNRDDKEFTPLLRTPQFPEYTSGHSIFSTTAARILEHYFGSNTAFTMPKKNSYGTFERSYSSVLEASEEAAESRIYGGIHFREAVYQGIQQGNMLVDDVLESLTKQ